MVASGYATIDWLGSGHSSHDPEPGESAVAAFWAADQAVLIQELHQRFGAMLILLDLERDSVEAREEYPGTGAEDFWLSEIGPSDLLLPLRLHRTIQQRLDLRPALLQLDDLSVEPTTRTVRPGVRVVALSAREFILLQLLLRRQGQVLSSDLLLQESWQGERSSSNVVEVYERYLRQKLESGGEHRLLHTIRGRVYSFGQVMLRA